jgi:protease-4
MRDFRDIAAIAGAVILSAAEPLRNAAMAEQASKPFILFRPFLWLWGGLNFVRRLVFGLAALFVVFAMLAGLGKGAKPLESKTALVIAPEGAIVEQYSASPIDRAIGRALGDEVKETQLRDILRALEAAAKDPKIDRVVLLPDKISGAGISTLREIAAAMLRFRESGKEIVAFGDGFSQGQYYLAAHANRIYMHPDAGVMLEGFGGYGPYLKGAFEKLGAEVRLFRVGEFKSAGEFLVRSDMSDEAREAQLYWLGDLWTRFVGEIAAQRNLEAADLIAGVDNAVALVEGVGGDLGQLALDQGLVDELKTRDQLRAELIEKGARDADNETFRQVDLSSYLAHVDLAARPKPGQPQIAIVVAQGEIVDGEQPAGTVGGDSTAKLLRDAREDDNVRAIVLRVDSPGGSAFASEVIRREIELAQQAGKPVVASMGDVAASGGYWISMNADRIIADPSTITGSIGVFGLWLNFPEGLSKLGISTDGAATSWMIGAFDPTRPFDERAGRMIQQIINHIYDEFITKVGEARGKEPSEIDAVARGRVWSGQQALERGLVDATGSLGDAIAAAAELAELAEGAYRVRYVEKELTPLQKILADALKGGAATWIADLGISLPSAWLPSAHERELARVKRLAADVLSQRRPGVIAHCNCTEVAP